MFANCLSLSSLPDISKWNTSNVIDMSGMFTNCSSLLSLPDISKWNTINVTYIIVHLYYYYLIYQNGILVILLI